MQARPTANSSESKSLAELGLPTSDFSNLKVNGIAASSGDVAEGFLFAALAGVNVHGAAYAAEAAAAGAAAILTDREGAAMARQAMPDSEIALIVADDPRKSLAQAASEWFGSGPEVAVAVTGTNGKSSVVSMCRQLWDALGRRAASFGTLGVEGVEVRSPRHTTPDPIETHRLLSSFLDCGITHVALEASSHGLVQRRLAGLRPSAAAFTNLTHDHLDYHRSMASYFEAKALLFTEVLPADGTAVICADSGAGMVMAQRAAKSGVRVIRLGGDKSDLRIIKCMHRKHGLGVMFEWLGRRYSAELDLAGEFQVRNALTAAALVVAAGEEIDQVVPKLPLLRTVPGRLELAATSENGSPVYVDYAHTPDALRMALGALRQHHFGRLAIVFGAGGERDRTKRRPMGETAARLADIVIITDDNPRGEDPALIRTDILQACPKGIEIPDRAEAILRGIALLEPGDALLIAGKGHETGQEVDGVMHPFNDIEQASIAVEALRGALP